MPSKLNDMLTDLGSETTRRLIQANRASFALRMAERRIHALEAALATAQAEAAHLRDRLGVVEGSKSWRLTRPIRSVVSALLRGSSPMPDTPPITDPQLQYEDWIRTEEAACRAAFAQPKAAHYVTQPRRLGLVLWATPGCDPALTKLLAECPSPYSVLILDQDAAVLPLLERDGTQRGRVLRLAVPPELKPADAVAIALDRLDTDMLCFLDARDRLAPDALALAADAAASRPLDLLFADEDWLDASGRRVRPFFKPDWDPELQRGRDLVGPFAFMRTALVRMAEPPAGPAWLYDLTNQVAAAAQPGRIHHIPAVLCHRTTLPEGHAAAMPAAAAAQLRREGVAARVEPHPDTPGWNRVTYALPQPPPLVSIIVPTRDRADLLRTCADGVLNGTDYPRLELLIVDNGSVEPDALALLDRLAADERVHVLRQPGAFNWSALNNAAAARASGAILVLLNNDIAVLQPDWLTVLVSHAIQPGVGAVGAKLLYPDGRVQHAGLTTDLSGVPRHLFRFLDGAAPGAFGLASLARDVWGVTGACLAIPREVFFGIGGLNEAFPVAYNDVELCLRLTAYGYRILWTPWSRLEHREMATRPPDHTAARRGQVVAELEQLLRDWGEMILCDPFLNPNLQLIDEQPQFRKVPMPVLIS